MTIDMIEVEEFNQGTRIKVIGVGGGGALREMDGGFTQAREMPVLRMRR